jgi:2-haloacid dehalogenase
VDPEHLLALFGELESAAEAGPYRTYREVLILVARELGARLGVAVAERDAARFADSVGDWPPFPDTTAALTALGRRFKLAIISNVDDDLFARTNARLGVRFDWIITAQQVKSYKPSPNNFHQALARIGVPKEQVLHVAQSLFHDHVPAQALGIQTVWVNRRGDRPGSGATPPADVVPDLEVPDLATLARL